jgi:recombination protein RecA
MRMAESKQYSSTDALLVDMQKKFGENSISRLGDSSKVNTKFRSSGSLRLDWALGGGYGEGRMLILSGKEASGKTLLANLAIAESQLLEPEKENAVIDMEYSYRPEWAETIGVNTKRLIISQPDTYAEKVWEMIEMMVMSGKFAYIVLDSVDSLQAKCDWDNTDWDKANRVGGTSGVNTNAMKKIVHSGLLTNSGTTLILIHQLRDDIGAFSMYGTPTRLAGGRAIKHAATQILEVNKGEQFVKGTGNNKEVLGQKIKVKVAKNKLAPPYTNAELDMYYATGVDKIMELVDTAKLVGVLQGTSWLKYIDPTTGELILDSSGNEVKWNGINKAVEAVKADIQAGGSLYNEMYDLVNKALRGV